MERDNLLHKVYAGFLGLLLLLPTTVYGGETVYTKQAIAPECEQTYADAAELFNQTVKDELDGPARRAVFEEHLFQVDEACRTAFASGLFDAQNLFHQTLALEYGMELWQRRKEGASPLLMSRITEEFRERFVRADLPETLTQTLGEHSEFFVKHIPAFIERMRGLAREQEGAVRLGRFIFVGDASIPPQTLYDWDRDSQGRMKTTNDNQVALVKGSYQEMAESIWKRMLANAQEYCEWQPSLFFGQDSWWYGSFWRAWNPNAPTVRGEKEKGYFQTSRSLKNFARRLELKMTDFNKIHQQMLNKQKAVLERDLQVYRNTQYALYAAPLIPVGMALGTAGFAYAGLTALPAGTASFTFVGGSVFSAANAAALTSLATITTFAGIGTYHAIRAEIEAEGPIRWAIVFDQIVGVTVQSFPLAAFAPAAIGGGAAGVKYLCVSVPAFIQNGMNMFRTIKALGVRGTLRAIPGQILKGGKWWFQTWWRNKKVLGFNYLGNMITAVGFEVYSREFVLGGEHRMLPRDEHGNIEWFNWSEYNRHSLVTLGGYAIAGVLFQPALKMKSILGRSLYAQTLTITSVAVASAVVEGEVDVDRVYFETEWSLAYSRWRSEALRPVYLSKFVTGHSAFRQTALTILMNIMLGTLESPVRNYLLDEYMHHGVSPVSKFREVSLDYALVDVSDFSDDEITDAWEEFFTNPSNADLIGQVEMDFFKQ